MQDKSSAIIAAAGVSRRMEGHDKLWTLLAGRIILARTIDVFEASPIIDDIVLVLNAERIDDATTLCQQEGWQKISGIVAGGLRRQDSVRIGLETLANIECCTGIPGCHSRHPSEGYDQTSSTGLDIQHSGSYTALGDTDTPGLFV